jgi:PhnB protein
MKPIRPYLMFDGNCRDAMAFYRELLGGELEISTFAEGSAAQGFEVPPEVADQVMHASLQRGDLALMASDSGPGGPVHRGNDVWLNLECSSAEEVDRIFDALADGGKPSMKPADAFWGDYFAMVGDRFGVNWMLTSSRSKG